MTQQRNDRRLVGRLTSRQKQIARLLRDGLTRSAIAALLDISPGVVKSELACIYHLLNVDGEIGLVAALLLPLDSPLRQRPSGG